MKKRLLYGITIVLTVISLVCILTFSVGAAGEKTPSVSIDKFNLVFDDNVYLKYAVKFDGVAESAINEESVGMLYFTSPQSEYTEANAKYSSTVVGFTTISGVKYYTFEYRHISAKQMTDYIYSVAYIDIDGERFYSAPAKYSVLDYACSKLGMTGTASTNANLKAMLKSMLNYGADAQRYFSNYKVDRLANANYYLIEVIGGVLEDGFTKGLYNSGETATLTAPEAKGDLIFSHWENSTGEIVSTESTANLTGFSKNETYTAVYKEPIKYTEGLEYHSSSKYCYVIGIGTATDTDIIIPPSYNGLPVTAIGNYAFEECTSLTSITIPESVTTIGLEAFAFCTSLKSITIPDSVTEICDYAFRNCTSLASISFGENSSLKKIFHAAFSDCTSLTSITIPESVTTIGNYAFGYCTSLESITIPDSVTTIGASAFYRCTSLESVSFGENSSLETIGNYAFSGCTSLTSISIPDSVTSIGSNAFSGCRSLESVSFGENSSLETIGDYAFRYCTSLTSITIPERVTIVGSYAFASCDIFTIYCEATSQPSGWNTDWNSSNCPVVWDCNNNDIADDGNIYVIIDGVRYALKDNNATLLRHPGNIVTANITPSIAYKGIVYNVTTISQDVFSGCDSLASITIPESVTTIGSNAFSGCTSLESVSFGENSSLETIGSNAFYNCTSLTSISIPDSVTSIGSNAFSGCTSLESASFGENSSLETIGSNAFSGCTSLTSISIPDSVTSIGSSAFDDCISFTIYCEAASQPSGWDSCWNIALCPVVWDCKNNDVADDGNIYVVINGVRYAIKDNKATVARQPQNIVTANITPSIAYKGIVYDVTAIGYKAFYTYKALKSITIPASVTTIGDWAFYYCRSLADVYYVGTAENFEKINIGYSNDFLIDATIHYCDCIDENGDYHCDICNAIFSHQCVDANCDALCDVCFEEIKPEKCEQCIDSLDSNGICDVCHRETNCDCEDLDGDEFCDLCGAYVSSEEDDTVEYPWDKTTLLVQLTENTNYQDILSVSKKYLAGDFDGADTIAEAARTRNLKAANASKVAIIYTYYPDTADFGWGQNIERITQTNNSGTDVPDIYTNFVYDMVGASLKNNFANLLANNVSSYRGTNYFEFLKADYNAAADDEGFMYEYMQSLTLAPNRKMYVLSSDYFIDMVRAFYCIPVSVKLMEDYGATVLAEDAEGNIVYDGGDRDGKNGYNFDDFYDLVMDGEWTYDVLAKFSASVWKPSASNQGGCVLGDDIVGFAMASGGLAASGLLYSSSVEFITKTKNADGAYSYDYPADNEDFYAFCDATTKLFSEYHGIVYVKDGYSTFGDSALLAIRSRFTQNKVLFGDITLVGALEFSEYQDMKTSGGFGIVPVPVYREGDAYKTSIHNTGICGAISTVTANFSQCTAYLNALSTTSDEVLNNYYEYKLQYDLAQGSNGTVEMLKDMRDSVGSALDKTMDDALYIFNRGESGTGAENRWHSILAGYGFQVDIRDEYARKYNAKEALLDNLGDYFESYFGNY